MQRVTRSTAVAVLPAPPAGAGSPGYFTGGDAGTGTSATVPGYEWFNMIQEELMSVVLAAGLTPSAASADQLLAAIQFLISVGTVPAGTVAHFCSTSAPTGWIKANGALLSRTVYSDLFAAIGTTWGVGDGATTFAVPDLRGEFIRGLDDGRGIDAGRTLGTRQKGSLQTYDPEPTAFDPVGLRLPSGQTIEAAFGLDGLSGDTYSADNARYVAGGSGTTISNAAGVVRPRNVALLACIKY